ncbi:hypothetical protein A3C32_02580, partial [Candidatus Daviesbacteria bacterium RIFCSPHIGHO2_02_FULL_41_14]
MKNILRIIAISQPLYKILAILATLILTSSSLQLVAPILSKYIVDEILLKIQNQGGDINKLIILVSSAFGISLLALTVTVISERLGDHFEGRLRKFLTEKFYDKALTLPQSYYDSEISGKIINQLSRGIHTIHTFLNTASNFILPTFIQSIFTIGILAIYSWPIAVFMAILFPIYLSISYYSTVKWGAREVKKNEIEDSLRGRIHEVISSMRLVKGFGAEKREFSTVEQNLTEINKIYAKQSRDFHIYDFYRGLSLNIILFLVNMVVFYNAFQGLLTIGEMVLILQLVNMARIPLFAMSFILTNIQRAESGSKEYFELLDLSSTEDYKQKISPEVLKEPTIEFKDVVFGYEDSETVLDSISFKMGKREKVALVGHSGAGKTTIVNLILKFYEPQSGEIFLNDKNFKSLPHQLIRNNISLVYQENELFSSTIRENVAYGKNNALEKEIISALKLANAYSFVSQLPRGLDSKVGER